MSMPRLQTLLKRIPPRSWEAIVLERYGPEFFPLVEGSQPLYVIDGDLVPDSDAPTAVVKYISDRAKGLSEIQFACRYSGSVGPRVFSITTDPDVLPEGIEIVMDQAYGSLSYARSQGIPFSDPAVLRNLAFAVAELAYAMEQQGDAHCDLKPANIFLYFTPEGQSYYRLGDFGISRSLEDVVQLMSGDLRFFGTSGYMSPEFLMEGSSHPTPDIFSYGMVLYWAAVGELPSQLEFDHTASSRESYAALMQTGHYRRVLQEKLPVFLDPVIQHVIQDCTDQSSARPTSFREVLDFLAEHM